FRPSIPGNGGRVPARTCRPAKRTVTPLGTSSMKGGDRDAVYPIRSNPPDAASLHEAPALKACATIPIKRAGMTAPHAPLGVAQQKDHECPGTIRAVAAPGVAAAAMAAAPGGRDRADRADPRARLP